MAGNFCGSMASYYFVIKHSWLLMMDLRIMPVMAIIRHKTFAVVRKTAKYAKVSCHESFMVYGMSNCNLILFSCSLNCGVGVNGQDYNVTIMATPNMTSYTVGGNLMLRCVVDPVPSSTAITVTYSWECFGCFANEINSSVINQVLTDMDTSMINCSATINGTVYRSDVFDLQVTQSNFFIYV